MITNIKTFLSILISCLLIWSLGAIAGYHIGSRSVHWQPVHFVADDCPWETVCAPKPVCEMWGSKWPARPDGMCYAADRLEELKEGGR